MEATAAREPQHNRFLIIVVALSALLTAGHFMQEHLTSYQAATTIAQAQVNRV